MKEVWWDHLLVASFLSLGYIRRAVELDGNILCGGAIALMHENGHPRTNAYHHPPYSVGRWTSLMKTRLRQKEKARAGRRGTEMVVHGNCS